MKHLPLLLEPNKKNWKGKRKKSKLVNKLRGKQWQINLNSNNSRSNNKCKMKKPKECSNQNLIKWKVYKTKYSNKITSKWISATSTNSSKKINKLNNQSIINSIPKKIINLEIRLMMHKNNWVRKPCSKFKERLAGQEEIQLRKMIWCIIRWWKMSQLLKSLSRSKKKNQLNQW